MMDIHKIIGNLPRPKKGFVLPSHKYTGPYNPLDEQLDKNDNPVPGQEPFNAVDAISMRHDICYRDHGTSKADKHECDDSMLKELDVLEPKNIREKIDRKLVKSLIGAKRKLGLGVVEWTDPLTDELHKPVRTHFKKRKVFAKKTNDIMAADLVDMQYFAKTNKGFRYILMVIDVFSKYGYAIPVKNKTAEEMVKAFTQLWDLGMPHFRLLWTDKGREFDNKQMRELLSSRNVHMYWTENEEKSTVVERWNRTIKQWMWKYFTKHRTGVYIDILPQLIEKYNNTYHRSIKCTPADARKPSNHQHVFNALYAGTNKSDKKLREPPKFHVNDQVRITKKKGHFEKGYTTNWTEEVFIVTEVQPTFPYTYKLKDTKAEKVIGTFYEPELQLAKQITFRIEKVLRRRTTKEGKKEFYVKWLGYSKDFNQWIPAEDVEQ
jgi:hypothetical protein